MRCHPERERKARVEGPCVEIAQRRSLTGSRLILPAAYFAAARAASASCAAPIRIP